jgi:YVTN family beta-propeller protein
MRKIFAVILLSAVSLPAQNTLLVLQKEGSSLGFYKPDGTRLAAVPVGQHPHEMVLSSDGRFAYTTDNGTMKIEHSGKGGNTISIIDLKDRKRVGIIDLGEYYRPHGIDIDHAAGRLAVSTENPDKLLIVDLKSRKVVKTYDTKGKTAHMVKFGPGAKWAYVSNSSSANVAAIRLDGGEVKLIPTGERPEGSVLSRDGKLLYVANREGATVSIIDTTKNEKVGDINTGKGPVRISLTPDGGTLVYALIHDNKVEMADPASGRILGQVALGGPPVSLTISSDGQRAYASAEEKNIVYMVSVPDRKILREIKLPQGSGPDPVLEQE